MSRKRRTRKPTKENLSVLAELCNLIPDFLTSELAQAFGVGKKARTFSPWSHLVALLFAQIMHSMSLISFCDALKRHSPKLSRNRTAIPSSKNREGQPDRNLSSNLPPRLQAHTQALSEHRLGN